MDNSREIFIVKIYFSNEDIDKQIRGISCLK